MNILALETSFPDASIALHHSKETQQHTFHSDRKQNTHLFPALEPLLQDLQTLDLIIVGAGPGSYSGTRIALAAAQGLSIHYNCPVITIPSYCGTPELLTHSELHILGNARRATLFTTTITPQTLTPEFTFFPETEDKTNADYAYFGFDPTDTFSKIKHYTQLTSTAKQLITYWNQLPLHHKEHILSRPPQALYLRPPFITKAKSGHPLLRKKPDNQT